MQAKHLKVGQLLHSHQGQPQMFVALGRHGIIDMFYLIDSENNLLTSCDSRESLQVTIDAHPNESWTIQEGSFEPDYGDWIWTNNALARRPETQEEILLRRRDERKEIFAFTIDAMSAFWHNSLSSEQQQEIATWRQAWLDYPATGNRPDDLDIFSGWDRGLSERGA